MSESYMRNLLISRLVMIYFRWIDGIKTHRKRSAKIGMKEKSLWI